MREVNRRQALAGIGALGGAMAAGTAHAFAAADYVATWSGTLLAGATKLRLKLIIADGAKAGLFSLDQGGAPIRASAVTLKDDGVVLEFALIGARYEGHLTDKDTLTGTFTQGAPLPLEFKRGDLFKPTSLPVVPLTAPVLGERRKAADVVAAAAAFAKDGKPATVYADGLRSKTAETPVTVNDLWHLGSNTKSMTATLVARLIEAGGITWDSTVDDILGSAAPKMQDSYKRATFRHLLSHRAGLQRDIDSAQLTAFPRDRDSDPRADRLRYATLALEQTPAAALGEKTLYANNGYVIAGAMLETVYKKSWETLLGEQVFQPLKLASAGFGAPGTPDKLDQPVGHINGVPFLPGRGRISDLPVAMGPAGLVHMSLQDLVTYLNAHMLQPVTFLKPENWKTLHTPPFGGDYAMGWGVNPNGTLQHNGSNGFWYAQMAFDPAKKIVAAAASNEGGRAEVQALIGGLVDCAFLAAANS